MLLLGSCALSASALSADNDSGREAERVHQIALKVCSAYHVSQRPKSSRRCSTLRGRRSPKSQVAQTRRAHRCATSSLAPIGTRKTLPLTMPNPELTDSQITDVVTYILNLRPQ